jgi:hypothetical protein
VYEVTNWEYPEDLLPNGLFELGCFREWTLYYFTNQGMNLDLVPCAKGECPPGGGNYYAHMYGQGTSLAASVPNIANYPVVRPGINYTISCWVSGSTGQLVLLTENGNVQGPTATFNSTAWIELSVDFVGAYDSGIILQAENPCGHHCQGPTDFKVNGCKVQRKG